MVQSLRIGFQGIAGAFSEQALRHWWPDGDAIGFPSFDDVVDALSAGRVHHAVLPVENLIAGRVAASLRAIERASPSVRVVDDVSIPIELCLVALPGATTEQIASVMSHPVALAQCGLFLRDFAARVEEHEDTAAAARAVRDAGDLSRAAIASAPAADQLGLVILKRGVQDRPENWTRFVRLDREQS
jgi:prephenate dehydratase